MRLQALVPLLPAGLVETLEQCGFRTDTDLLFSGTAMDIFRRLPSDTLTFQELKRCIALVAEKASAPAVRGDAWLAMEIPNRHEMLSGVTELDKLLGGFGDSRVIEISGEKGSGKTALALQVVLRHLACHPLSAAAWVDTTGEFSAERSAHMLNSSDGQAISTALERLQVSLAFDIEATHDVLEALLSSLSSNSSSQPVIRCVVIDTITPLLGPSLSNISSQGHAIMTTFMRQLRAIAQSHLLTFLVINNTTASTPSNPHSAFSTTAKKPALGPSFTFLTDATLWLSKYATEGLDPETDREDSATMHVAEVFRSKYTRSRTWCTFKIRRGILVED